MANQIIQTNNAINELKEKFKKIVQRYKNNRKPGNKHSYERGHSEAKVSKDKDIGYYI